MTQEPGRVLVESYPDGVATTFNVEPRGGGSACEVTFRSEWERGGPVGWFQRLLAPRMLAKVYEEELENLAKAAEGLTDDRYSCYRRTTSCHAV